MIEPGVVKNKGTPPTSAKLARAANGIVKSMVVKARVTFDAELVVTHGAFRCVATDRRERETAVYHDSLNMYKQ